MKARSRRLLSTSLLMAAALAGCADSGTEPSAPSVTGTWTGRATVNADFAPTFRLTLLQSDAGSITGSGHLATDDGDYSVDVMIGAGVSDFPAVNFAILNPSRGDILFSGTLDRAGSRIQGDLSGSGMEGVRLVLERQ
jgi:hypothetical protein